MLTTIFCFCLLATSCESKKSLVPQAILQLVQSYYGKSSVTIEIFYDSKNSKVLDETLKLLSEVKELRVTKINGTDAADGKIIDNINCQNNSYSNDAIFLVNDIETYLKFRAKIWCGKPKSQFELLNFLVHCKNLTKLHLQSKISPNSMESFLIEENNEVSLHLMALFTEKKCRIPKLIEINRFSNSKKRWTTEKFLSITVDNFHGCTLWFGILQHSAVNFPFINGTLTYDGHVLAEGVIIDMIGALSTSLNFTVTFDEEPGLSIDYEVALKMLNEISYERGELSSNPICSTSHVFVVPPGEFYTSWEKLLLPFDRDTWMWIGITFVTAFIFIIFIKLTKSTSIYDFVIGPNVTTPGLNIVAIFFGIGQILLPHRNIARFIFINFVWFCLIMRTAYQGMYFEYLTSDMRKKPISTVEELRERNFTLFVDKESSDAFVNDNHLDILKG